MDRDTLKEFGLDEELIEKVMREHGKVVNSLKDEKSTIEQELESEKTKAVGLSEQIEERNEQLEKIKNENKNVEGLQETINQLKQSNSQKEEELKNQVSDTKRKYEIKLGLQKAKARNEKSVLANLDEEAITLDEEGNLVGFWEQIEKVKESDSYLFEDENSGGQSHSSGSVDYIAGNPNKQGNGGKDVTDEEFGKSLSSTVYGTSDD